jgi:opacity protein-like surface antigen
MKKSIWILVLAILAACAPSSSQIVSVITGQPVSVSVCQHPQKGQNITLSVLALNSTSTESGKALVTCLNTLGWTSKLVGGVDFESRFFDGSEYGVGLDFGQYASANNQLKAIHTVGIKTKSGTLVSSVKFEMVFPYSSDVSSAINKANAESAIKAAIIAHQILLER